MECVDFFQVFIMCFRSLTSSSSSSSSSSSAAAAAADTDIPPLQEKYEVFISFRGEDTRLTLTSHLYEALCRKKIESYIDYRLVRGGEIAPALLEAIQRSTISVIIFSKNYASSTWCLDELVHILECKEKNGQLVIPIFYDISPSDVRKQQGSYALAFPQHKCNKVHKWRTALTQAANLAGFDHSDKTEPEASLVKKVVQDIWTKLNRESSSDLKGLFGIERKIEQIESLLCFDSPGVYCVGVWGMGGIGKTTLADAVFHRLSCKFETCCFLGNVREKSEQTNGLHQLRNKLVGEILKEEYVNIDTPSIPLHIQDRLRRSKALIVLDDVNDASQLEVLVGHDHDLFCQGSRIIITARDKGVLEQKVDHDKIYEVEGLSSVEALQLFHSHAFRNKSPPTEYNDLSGKVVDYINGIPLGLKVMGSLLLSCGSTQEWENQLNKLKRFPSEQIKKVLRVSYDGLEENEKEIFLDIACFHKGNDRNFVKEFLDSRDFHGEAGIKVLIDRSLISISKDKQEMESKDMESDNVQEVGRRRNQELVRIAALGNRRNQKLVRIAVLVSKAAMSFIKAGPIRQIEMHDLVQEMGMAIAREQGSRLFNADDVYQILTNNQRAVPVQAISCKWSKKLHLEHANFEKMDQLRCLRVSYLRSIVSLDLPNSLRYLDWVGYPLKSLPSKFSAQNLLVLDVSSGNVGPQLWNEDQSPVNLKRITLRFSRSLTEVPNLSRSLKIEHIDMYGCDSLLEIPLYFQHLGKLTYLRLGCCKKLKNLPEMPCNLEFLDLSETSIEELPSSVWSHEKISHLDITYCTHLKNLPSNSCKLKLSGPFSLEGCKSLCEFWELPTNTRVLYLSGSINFVSLPTNIWKLKSLESLDLSLCSKFQNFPEISEAMEHLKFLNLSGTAVKEVPPSIGNLVALRKLDLSDCKNLVSLPTNIWKLKSLEGLDLRQCSKFQNFPEISIAMEHLEFLKLSGTAVKEVPPSIGNLVALQTLDLSDCKNLEVVPDYLFCLTSLQELYLSSSEITSISASIKQAAQLSRLCLKDCKSLESLPELPPLLQCLIADGCTSLKTVSSSSTAITQSWEEYIFYRGLYEKHTFSRCPKFDENARSSIMADAQLKIMRMATASSKFEEDKIEEKIDKELFSNRSCVAIRCWGYEIPKWFSRQSEGCSIKIELPRDWFSTDFLGFALSLVVAATEEDYMKIGCKYNFRTSNGESHEVNHPRGDLLPFDRSRDSHDVLVWWYNNIFEEVVEGAGRPTAFYNRFTEVNVDFNVQPSFAYFVDEPFWVEKCGICLLYGKDAEMIKQRALYGEDA